MSKGASFLTIKQKGSNELIIKKSKFIASMDRTSSVTQAEKFIKQVSQHYKDATHNTFAYTIGLNGEHVKASDNGEPSGTAGVPELKALQLMNLKNVTVVVTRYFGGIKLGAGGLIRAYSGSVTQAAQKIGVVKSILQQEIKFTIPYQRFDQVRHYLQEKQIFLAPPQYGVQVTLSIFLDESKQSGVLKDLTNLLAGKITFSKGQKRYHEIPVRQNNFHEQ